MSVSIDTAALESNYRNMSDEEFASIRSQDLTPEALPVFERVALDRGVDVEAKTSLSAAKIQHVDTSTPRHRQMASHLDLISVASLILGGLCGLMGVLTLGGEKRTTALAFPIFLLPAALLIAGGVGIRLRAPWGRVVTLIGSILFIACPISWYVLWVMTRRESKELFGWTPRPGDLDYLAAAPSAPRNTSSATDIPAPPPVSRIVLAPRSTFWLTWKEFLTVMAALIALGGLSIFGDSNRTTPPYKGMGDSIFDAAQLVGTLGGIYIVTFLGRMIRRRHVESGASVACTKCGRAMTIDARFCNSCGQPVGATSTAA